MDRCVATGGGIAAAEAFDDPHGIDAGFWRKEFLDRAFPLRLQVVAFRAGAINALIGGFRRRHRGIFGELAFLFEERGDFAFNFFFAFGVEELFFGEKFFAESDGVTFFPVGRAGLWERTRRDRVGHGRGGGTFWLR